MIIPAENVFSGKNYFFIRHSDKKSKPHYAGVIVSFIDGIYFLFFQPAQNFSFPEIIQNKSAPDVANC